MPTNPGTTVEKPVLLVLTVGDDATGILSAIADVDFFPPAIFSATALAVVFLEPDSDGLAI
jgi:hypothetical protein